MAASVGRMDSYSTTIRLMNVTISAVTGLPHRVRQGSDTAKLF